jgi:hypothetical protein
MADKLNTVVQRAIALCVEEVIVVPYESSCTLLPVCVLRFGLKFDAKVGSARDLATILPQPWNGAMKHHCRTVIIGVDRPMARIAVVKLDILITTTIVLWTTTAAAITTMAIPFGIATVTTAATAAVEAARFTVVAPATTTFAHPIAIGALFVGDTARLNLRHYSHLLPLVFSPLGLPPVAVSRHYHR